MMNLLLGTFLKPTLLYMSWEEKQLPPAVPSNLFVDLCYRRIAEATQGLNVPKIFHDLGRTAPKQAKLRVPFQFVPPQHQVEGADPNSNSVWLYSTPIGIIHQNFSPIRSTTREC